MNSQITALLQMGADAMDNLYDVIITPPTQLDADQNSVDAIRVPVETQLRLRAQGFDPPKFSQDLYEVRYKTVGMKRPAPAIKGDRQFQVTFRVDANYQIYKLFLKWRGLFYVPDTGFATNALPGEMDALNGELSGADEAYYGRVAVHALAEPVRRDTANPASFTDAQGIAGNQENQTGLAFLETIDNSIVWDFKHVWLSDLTEPSYKNGGGQALTVQATFQFGEFSSPLTQKLNSQLGGAPPGGGAGTPV